MVSFAALSPEDGQDYLAAQPVETPQPNPVAALARAMRGRWKAAVAVAAVLGPVCATAGYLAGIELFESQAILRVYPQESNILYATGDDSVLKTFDSFLKAETTYVASHPVMARSVETLAGLRPDLARDLKASDLAGSIEVKRSDSLIVLKTLSRDRAFASQKLDAVIAAYLALKSEAEDARTSVRLAELRDRELALMERLSALRSEQLEVGGEFGLNALAKAHIEKIAQIDALAARKSEVSATLAALSSDTGESSADTTDQEIMRATLLDRAMADLSFERAKLMSALAGLRADYADISNPRFRQKEKAKIEEIAVIERAMDERREQIRVLGQTGALTDVTETGDETTLAEIQSLFEKVSGQLESARAEARDLNRRRIELDGIENEIVEAERLLTETRRALEVIRLESGRALPGYAVLMSPPSQPVDPSEDTRTMLAAGGLAGGAGLALVLILAVALRERRLRFAETLAPHVTRLPVVQVTDAGEGDAHAADLLRNELQLHPLRKPRLVGKAPIIAVTRAGAGETTALGRALARSFARAQVRTLYIEGDLGGAPGDPAAGGWRGLLSGAKPQPWAAAPGEPWEFSDPGAPDLDDRSVSAPMVKSAIEAAARGFDAVVISAGGLSDRLSAQLILSNADVGVLVLNPTDLRETVLGHLDRLDSLPRNGSVAVMRNARAGDPWLAVRT